MQDLAMDKWTNKNVYGASVMGLDSAGVPFVAIEVGKEAMKGASKRVLVTGGSDLLDHIWV